jgi:hypothetical protein
MQMSVFERNIRFIVARTLLEHSADTPDEHTLAAVREKLLFGISLDKNTFNKMFSVFPKDRQIAVKYTFCKTSCLACADSGLVRFVNAELRLCSTRSEAHA